MESLRSTRTRDHSEELVLRTRREMKNSLSRLQMRAALSSAIVGVRIEDVAGSGDGIVEGGSSRATWKISTSRHRESSARMSSFLPSCHSKISVLISASEGKWTSSSLISRASAERPNGTFFSLYGS